jgi:hypothetical protein
MLKVKEFLRKYLVTIYETVETLSFAAAVFLLWKDDYFKAICSLLALIYIYLRKIEYKEDLQREEESKEVEIVFPLPRKNMNK